MTEERANKRVVWEPARPPLAAPRRHNQQRPRRPLPLALRTRGGCKPFSTEAYGARLYKGGWSAPVMLLCLSSGQWRSVFEESVEAAGEVALEAAVGFASCLAFLDASLDVGDRRGV